MLAYMHLMPWARMVITLAVALPLWGLNFMLIESWTAQWAAYVAQTAYAGQCAADPLSASCRGTLFEAWQFIPWGLTVGGLMGTLAIAMPRDKMSNFLRGNR